MKSVLFIFITGALMVAAGFGMSIAASSVSPALNAEYINPEIFRPWNDPLMKVYWLVPFVTAAILYWLWIFTRSHFKSTIFLRRGIYFGFLYWFITLPGMVMTYVSFQLSFGLVFMDDHRFNTGHSCRDHVCAFQAMIAKVVC